MANEQELQEIILEEKKILKNWNQVIIYLREDLDNILTKEVKAEFAKIKNEAGRIGFLLLKLYKLNKSKRTYNEPEYSFYLEKKIELVIAAIKDLIDGLNKSKAKQVWVERINNDIREILSSIESISSLEPTVEKGFQQRLQERQTKILYNNRLRRLNRYFDVNRNQVLALFMVRRWKDTNSILNMRPEARDILLALLLNFQHGIDERIWIEIVELSNLLKNKSEEILKRFTKHIYKSILHILSIYNFKKIITDIFSALDKHPGISSAFLVVGRIMHEQNLPKMLDDLIAIDKSIRDGGEPFFLIALPAMSRMISPRSWQQFVDGIKRISKFIRVDDCRFSFPQVGHILDERTWEGYIEMIELLKDVKKISHAIHKIESIVSRETWDGIIEIVRSGNEKSIPILEYTLPALNHLLKMNYTINIRNWQIVKDGLIDINRNLEGTGFAFFELTIPSIKELITIENWKELVKFVEIVGPKSYYLLNVIIKDKADIQHQELPSILSNLSKVSELAKKEDVYFFSKFLEIFNGMLNRHNFNQIYLEVYEMRKLESAGLPTLQLLGSIKPIINKEVWPDLVHILTNDPEIIGQASFHYFKIGVYNFSSILTSDNYRIIVNLILKMINRAKENISILVNVTFPSLVKIYERDISSFWSCAEELPQLINNIGDKEELSDFISKFLPAAAHLISKRGDINEIYLFYHNNFNVFKKIHFGMATFIEGTKTKEELAVSLEKIKSIMNDKRYYTVQGLTSMGFLCCHVTNAFAGGAAGQKDVKKDPFENIIKDINNAFDYNPSASILKPYGKSRIVVTDNGYIGGSIGIIYDYGYVYQSYFQDTGTRDVISKNSDKSFRTGDIKYGSEAGLVANLSEATYNEVLLRKWTVSAIFHTKGCHQWVIERLVEISNLMSHKEYLNGAYFYRILKLGTPKYITKIFPIYEIDLSNTIWKEVYKP